VRGFTERPRPGRRRADGSRGRLTDLHRLRLSEDRVSAGQGLRVAPAKRILWVAEGEISVSGAVDARLESGQAWHGAVACRVTSPAGAHVLRWELLAPTTAGALSEPTGGTIIALEHPIALDPATPYLMRCDRVDFAPGGEARPHGHRGGGIRRLLAGELEVRIGPGPGRIMKPGDAWFESGVEPVHALASRSEPTSFIRVSVLPRLLRGQSSIVYVDPADAAVKPRQYTVYVDEPIAIG
jgi:quercetin dioxygenase-like cupin family protein